MQQPRRGRPPKQSFDDEGDAPESTANDKIVGAFDEGNRVVLTASTREGLGMNRPNTRDDDTKPEMTIADPPSVEDVFGSLR